LDLQADTGGKHIARNVHQTADKLAATIGPHKETHLIALIDPGDPGSHVKKLIAVSQKQVFAWKGIQNLTQRLTIMTVRVEPTALEYAGHFFPQHRHLHGCKCVSSRRVQP